MGSLHGDVSLIGLATLFQTIGGLNREGTLTVSSGDRKKAIHFAPDGLRLLSSSARKFRLGDHLVRRRLITIEQLSEALREQKKAGQRLGEVLTRLGVIQAETISAVVRSQAEEEIFDMLFWPNAAFAFLEGPPGKQWGADLANAIQVDLDIRFIALEAARRLDEWTQVEAAIPSLDKRFCLTPQGEDFAKGTSHEDELLTCLLPLLDGSHTIHEIIETSGLTRFQVCQALFALKNQELVADAATRKLPKSSGVWHAAPSGGTDLSEAPARPAARSATPAPSTKKEGTRRTSAPAPAVKKEGTHRISAPAPMPATAPEEAASTPVPPPATPGLCVLLVDDEGYYRKITRFHLERAGYRVIEALTAQRALTMVRDFAIDAVISEISLPDRDGFTICRALRAIPKTKSVPILFVTGHNRREYILMARQAGANAYIVKPFTREVLLEKLQGALAAAASPEDAVAPAGSLD